MIALRPLDLALIAASLPVIGTAAYLALLAILARRTSALRPSCRTRFDVVVPAHDEAGGIARTVASILAASYPPERRRVLVVADNCADETAARARAAGALVLERRDDARRGKGYALSAAYERSLADGFADAVIVVDADTVISPNLLASFAARFERGAGALQAEYAVQGGRSSWRGRLMTLAFTLFHVVRSLGRERLRLSCGLRGNGMGFSADVLRRVPNAAYSLVEDVEYGIALGLAGVRVEYVAEARVGSEMPASGPAAATQRLRWERGRRELARRCLWPLLRAALARRDPVLLDLALDLAVPPLTAIAAAAVCGIVLSATAALLGLGSGISVAAWMLVPLLLAVYVGRGVAQSGAGFRALADTPWAAAYSLWKLGLALAPRTSSAPWIRTTRDTSRLGEKP